MGGLIGIPPETERYAILDDEGMVYVEKSYIKDNIEWFDYNGSCVVNRGIIYVYKLKE